MITLFTFGKAFCFWLSVGPYVFKTIEILYIFGIKIRGGTFCSYCRFVTSIIWWNMPSPVLLVHQVVKTCTWSKSVAKVYFTCWNEECSYKIMFLVKYFHFGSFSYFPLKQLKKKVIIECIFWDVICFGNRTYIYYICELKMLFCHRKEELERRPQVK